MVTVTIFLSAAGVFAAGFLTRLVGSWLLIRRT